MSVALVKFESSDEKVYEVPRAIAEMSATVRNMLEIVDDDLDSDIPLPNITSKILDKVIEYCTYHHGEHEEAEKTKWNAKFCEIDQSMLFELILAANYLDIAPLLDMLCKKVADMIRGKSPDEIRKTFCIKNDFTPEEEEQIRKENEWCMDL